MYWEWMQYDSLDNITCDGACGLSNPLVVLIPLVIGIALLSFFGKEDKNG